MNSNSSCGGDAALPTERPPPQYTVHAHAHAHSHPQAQPHPQLHHHTNAHGQSHAHLQAPRPEAQTRGLTGNTTGSVPNASSSPGVAHIEQLMSMNRQRKQQQQQYHPQHHQHPQQIADAAIPFQRANVQQVPNASLSPLQVPTNASAAASPAPPTQRRARSTSYPPHYTAKPATPDTHASPMFQYHNHAGVQPPSVDTTPYTAMPSAIPPAPGMTMRYTRRNAPALPKQSPPANALPNPNVNISTDPSRPPVPFIWRSSNQQAPLPLEAPSRAPTNPKPNATANAPLRNTQPPALQIRSRGRQTSRPSRFAAAPTSSVAKRRRTSTANDYSPRAPTTKLSRAAALPSPHAPLPPPITYSRENTTLSSAIMPPAPPPAHLLQPHHCNSARAPISASQQRAAAVRHPGQPSSLSGMPQPFTNSLDHAPRSSKTPAHASSSTLPKPLSRPAPQPALKKRPSSTKSSTKRVPTKLNKCNPNARKGERNVPAPIPPNGRIQKSKVGHAQSSFAPSTTNRKTALVKAMPHRNVSGAPSRGALAKPCTDRPESRVISNRNITSLSSFIPCPMPSPKPRPSAGSQISPPAMPLRTSAGPTQAQTLANALLHAIPVPTCPPAGVAPGAVAGASMTDASAAITMPGQSNADQAPMSQTPIASGLSYPPRRSSGRESVESGSRFQTAKAIGFARADQKALAPDSRLATDARQHKVVRSPAARGIRLERQVRQLAIGDAEADCADRAVVNNGASPMTPAANSPAVISVRGQYGRVDLQPNARQPVAGATAAVTEQQKNLEQSKLAMGGRENSILPKFTATYLTRILQLPMVHDAPTTVRQPVVRQSAAPRDVPAAAIPVRNAGKEVMPAAPTHSDVVFNNALQPGQHARLSHDVTPRATSGNSPEPETDAYSPETDDTQQARANDSPAKNAILPADSIVVSLTNDARDAPTTSTEKASGKVTTGKGSPYATGKGLSYATGKGSSHATGKGSSCVTGKGSSCVTGKGSSLATGKGSSLATGKGSSLATGKGSSLATGKGSSLATGKGTSLATGKGSSSATRKESARLSSPLLEKGGNGPKLDGSQSRGIEKLDGKPIVAKKRKALSADGKVKRRKLENGAFHPVNNVSSTAPASASAGVANLSSPAPASLPKSSKPGVKLVVKDGAKPVVKSGVKTGVKAVVKPGAKAGSKPIVKPGVKPVVKPAVKPVVKPVVKPGMKTAVKLVVKLGVKSVVKPGVKPVVKPGVKSVAKPGVKSVAKPGAKSVVKPGAKPVVKPGVKRVVTPSVEPIAKTSLKTGLKPGLSPGVKSIVKPRTDSIMKSGVVPGAKPGVNNGVKPGLQQGAAPKMNGTVIPSVESAVTPSLKMQSKLAEALVVKTTQKPTVKAVRSLSVREDPPPPSLEPVVKARVPNSEAVDASGTKARPSSISPAKKVVVKPRLSATNSPAKVVKKPLRSVQPPQSTPRGVAPGHDARAAKSPMAGATMALSLPPKPIADAPGITTSLVDVAMREVPKVLQSGPSLHDSENLPLLPAPPVSTPPKAAAQPTPPVKTPSRAIFAAASSAAPDNLPLLTAPSMVPSKAEKPASDKSTLKAALPAVLPSLSPLPSLPGTKSASGASKTPGVLKSSTQGSPSRPLLSYSSLGASSKKVLPDASGSVPTTSKAGSDTTLFRSSTVMDMAIPPPPAPPALPLPILKPIALDETRRDNNGVESNGGMKALKQSGSALPDGKNRLGVNAATQSTEKTPHKGCPCGKERAGKTVVRKECTAGPSSQVVVENGRRLGDSVTIGETRRMIDRQRVSIPCRLRLRKKNGVLKRSWAWKLSEDLNRKDRVSKAKTVTFDEEALKQNERAALESKKKCLRSADKHIDNEVDEIVPRVKPLVAQKAKEVISIDDDEVTERLVPPAQNAARISTLDATAFDLRPDVAAYVPSSSICKAGCNLCGEELNEGYRHPFFNVRFLRVCKRCRTGIGAKLLPKEGPSEVNVGKTTDAKGREFLEEGLKQGRLFVAVLEFLLGSYMSGGCIQRNVLQAFQNMRNRPVRENVRRKAALYVPYDMVAVVAAVLTRLGVDIEDGVLVWPEGRAEFGVGEGLCCVQSVWEPMFEHDNNKGEVVWREVFEDISLDDKPASCVVMRKVLSLIGVKVEVCSGKCAHEKSSDKCEFRLDGCSLVNSMQQATSCAQDMHTKAIFGNFWEKKDVVRGLSISDLKEEEVDATTMATDMDGCCICMNEHDEIKYPFRFTECDDCERRFCSVCLTNVLGVSEYMMASRNGVYKCSLCRLQRNDSLFPLGSRTSRQQNGGDRRRQRHKRHARSELPVKTGRINKFSNTRRSQTPFLQLSYTCRKALLKFIDREAAGSSQDADSAAQVLGFAKLCETMNMKIQNGGRMLARADFERICLQCKKTFDEDGDDTQKLHRCSYGHCGQVIHAACISSNGGKWQSKKWTCGQHECAKCEKRDEQKLVRCRTCNTAFCKDDLPHFSETFVYSDRLIGCEKCAKYLRQPKQTVVEKLVPSGGAARSLRNNSTMHTVISNVKCQTQAIVNRFIFK